MSDNILDSLQEKLLKFAQEREWEGFHTPKNLAAALSIEASELQEHFLWLTAEESFQLSEVDKRAVSYEMADVMLYLLRMASVLNIDLAQACDEKIKINAEKYPIHLSKGKSSKYTELRQAVSKPSKSEQEK